MKSTAGSHWIARAIVLLGGCVLVPDAGAKGRKDTVSESRGAAVRHPVPRAEAGRERRRQRQLQRSWWNHPGKVEVLGLKDTQRKKMDRHLEAYLSGRRKRRELQRAAMASFGAAMVKMSQPSIAAARARVLETTSEPVAVQMDMMVKIFGELTAKQRQIVAKNFPGLIAHVWVHPVSPRRAPSGGGTRRFRKPQQGGRSRKL